MATVVHMPEVLTGVSEAAIQRWLVSEGSTVTVGTPLAEIETDKAVVEYAAELAGTVLRVLVQEGNQVAIGDPIAVIGKPGEAVPDGSDNSTPTASDPTSPVEALPSATGQVHVGSGDVSGVTSAESTADTAQPQGRLFASPLVRRLARERGVDLADISGTGPNGRVVRRDLDEFIKTAGRQITDTSPSTSAPAPESAALEYEDVPLTGMRRAIARRLTESKSTVPHFYVEADCRVDALLELRRQVNETAPIRVSVNDFVVKAVAAALVEIPEANTTWAGTAIRHHRTADVAVAVAIEGGLVTPVLRDADRMSLTQVSAAVADMVKRAKAGRLKQHELEGGSFSVSNLGMYGVTAFSAILNPPQSGILAVGAVRKMAVVEDDELAIGTVMTVTLSADHRVVDGAVAAQWLNAFVRRIEKPLSILI